MQKEDHLRGERLVACVGTVRRVSTRGKEMLNPCRDKKEGTYRSEQGGKEGQLCDPGSQFLLQFLLGGSARVMRG